MKIILTRPNYYTHLVTPPLGLGYLSSFLKKNEHEVEIIDGLNLSLNNEEIARRSAGAGLVGITCLSDFYLEAKDLAKRLKENNLRVVLGGPHPSALPQETLDDTGADFVVVGEGEQLLLGLVSDMESGKINRKDRGIYSYNNTINNKREFIDILDSLPFPDWAQIDPRKCKRAPHGAVVKRFPVAPLVTSRGCPYICKFCASPRLWSRTIRFRTPENVVDEIEYLVRDFQVKEIHFEDDNLTLKREHIENICRLILKRNLKISWATPNGIRADTLTQDLIRLMKKSGCYFVAFGIESGSQKILDNIRKKTDLAVIERAVRYAGSEGLITQGFFIFGLPGETEETIQETINFSKKIPLDRAQFLLLDVLPGSALWDELSGTNFADWHKRSYQEVSWIPPTIKKEALQRAPSLAFRSFFLRPKQLFRLIKYIRPYQLPFIIRRLMDFKIIPK